MAGTELPRLTSWKRIAHYLGRDVTTAIRWAKHKGLPVHRTSTGARREVYAFAHEIDAWMLHANADDLQDTFLKSPAASGTTWRRNSLIGCSAVAAAVVLVLLFTSGTGAGLTGGCRFDRADYGAETPLGMASGDLNGDGKSDLVFTNAAAGTFSVMLADGRGRFPKRWEIPVGREPERLVLADFNGDGILDVAATHRGSGEIRVLLGDGKGQFRLAFQKDAMGRSRWIAAADVNRDGRADIVVACSAERRLAVFLGRGDGTFSEPDFYGMTAEPSVVLIEDMNRDGKPDLVVADYSAATSRTISILRGRGDGVFEKPISYPTGLGPLGMTIADLSGQHRADIITADFLGSVSVLTATKSGYAAPRFFPAGEGNGYILAQDMNGDGFIDLLVLGEHSDTLSLLVGNGDATFRGKQDFATGKYPDSAAVADFDGDGRPDVAVGNTHGDSVSVFLNRTPGFGGRTFTAANLFPH